MLFQKESVFHLYAKYNLRFRNISIDLLHQAEVKSPAYPNFHHITIRKFLLKQNYLLRFGNA
ncbi:hypothetical protein D3C72_645010 [compost metagenome]